MDRPYNESDYRKRSDMIITSTSAFNLPIILKSKYEWRIVGLIMMKMQMDFGDHRFNFKNGIDLKNQKDLLDEIRFNKRSFGSIFREDETEVLFPIEILYGSDNGKPDCYKNAKEAIKNLSRPIEYENAELKNHLFDDGNKDSGIVWGLRQVIEKPDIRRLNGRTYVYFRVPESTWRVLCNWERGVHIFELSVFFKFERVASYPFYIFMADYRKKGEVIVPTNYLMDRFAPGKYRDYSAFKNKVIENVKKDLKEHSPFYFEIKEYSDVECQQPAQRGRGRAAKYARITIHYQQGKNEEIDEGIEIFVGLNTIAPFTINDLTTEETNFLSKNLCLPDIKGKNLETIVKLKYYKNDGHKGVDKWRNGGNLFMEYLESLYDDIMFRDKSIKDVAAYTIRTMQNALEAYEPSDKSPEHIQERQDAPPKTYDAQPPIQERWIGEDKVVHDDVESESDKPPVFVEPSGLPGVSEEEMRRRLSKAVEELRQSVFWRESVCMKFRSSGLEDRHIDSFLNEFLMDCNANGWVTDGTGNNLKSLFVTWLEKRRDKKINNKKQNGNGNYNHETVEQMLQRELVGAAETLRCLDAERRAKLRDGVSDEIWNI